MFLPERLCCHQHFIVAPCRLKCPVRAMPARGFYSSDTSFACEQPRLQCPAIHDQVSVKPPGLSVSAHHQTLDTACRRTNATGAPMPAFGVFLLRRSETYPCISAFSPSPAKDKTSTAGKVLLNDHGMQALEKPRLLTAARSDCAFAPEGSGDRSERYVRSETGPERYWLPAFCNARA